MCLLFFVPPSRQVPNASDLEGNWINQAGAPLIELEARTSKLAAAAPQFLHMLNVI